MTAPVLDRSDSRLVDEIVGRAGRPDFDRWADQVERCGYCARPVRLRGVVKRVDGTTYSTDAEPDRVLFVRCRNRRASVCPSCSYEYAGDMWQLLYAGAAGGRKGVPESVRTHPLVFATLTAPSFGPVHGTRTGGRSSRCRPPRGRPTVCPHSRPTWCTRIYTEYDPRLGEPLCADCYDYAGHAAFNWWAPELWRRFTITLRRLLARRTGHTPTDFGRRCRISFVKVAEFQRRGVVHFHALIRLDAAGDGYEPPPVALTTADLADAVREAAGAVRLIVATGESTPVVPALVGGHSERHGGDHPDQANEHTERPTIAAVGDRSHSQTEERQHRDRSNHPGNDADPPARVPGGLPRVVGHTTTLHPPAGLVLRFGEQVDAQPVGGPTGELTPDRVAAYVAKYATKSAEDFGLGERRLTGRVLAGDGISAHIARLVRTCWQLGELEDYTGIRRWIHMAGFRGHFASKSRRYSTTLGTIRGERRTFRRRQAAERARQLGLDPIDEDITLVVGRWEFAGLGYLTGGDAALALSAAARARERRQAARDQLHTNTAEDTSWTD